MELTLVGRDRAQTSLDMDREPDGVWTTFMPGVGAGQRYGFRVHGPWSPETGQRFNPAKLLLDPYARAIVGGVDYSGPISDHTPESNYLPETTDSFAAVPLSVVVAPTPPPAPLAEPLDPANVVVYETHLKGYTQLHPAVPEHLRGTYAGMAHPAVIDHLKDLGVNAVEFLPVHHFVSEPFTVGRGLVNYWGYNTLGFFAPHAPYSSSGTLGEQVTEFKDMVSALHAAGIAVILDVDYNHTAEGGHEGPTLSFRGIDHAGYYRLTDDLRNDYDMTGRGNTLDTSTGAVLKLVLDSMRYWAEDMGVDGFRLNQASTLIRDETHSVDHAHAFKALIAEDPVLADKLLIVDPVDNGTSGYQIGRWGHGWREWNSPFRLSVRDYWRGVGGVSLLATRLSGSSDFFDVGARPATSSVNFVASHDGFTLRDVVTYDLKHNEANGERNRDGEDDNRSWNHGYEGETSETSVTESRRRTMRNMMATLLLSVGTPMMLAGDEMGRTQQGNNNAYCQDTPTSWVNWQALDQWQGLYEFTRQLIALRASISLLRPNSFRTRAEVVDSDGRGLGRSESAWFNERGFEMSAEQWQDSNRHSLGLYLSDLDEAIYMFFHAGRDRIRIVLPGVPWSAGYEVLIHTGESGDVPAGPLTAGVELELPPQSLVVFRADVPKPRRI